MDTSMTTTIEPTASQIQAFATEGPDGPEGEITMLNLLRFRDKADYREGSEFHGDSGEQAYQRYAALVAPLLEAVGGKMQAMGKCLPSVIGAENDHFDVMLLVSYPNRAAFLQMATSADYRAIAFHRTVALEHSLLIPVTDSDNRL